MLTTQIVRPGKSDLIITPGLTILKIYVEENNLTCSANCGNFTDMLDRNQVPILVSFKKIVQLSQSITLIVDRLFILEILQCS